MEKLSVLAWTRTVDSDGRVVMVSSEAMEFSALGALAASAQLAEAVLNTSGVTPYPHDATLY